VDPRATIPAPAANFCALEASGVQREVFLKGKREGGEKKGSRWRMVMSVMFFHSVYQFIDEGILFFKKVGEKKGRKAGAMTPA